jgi:hypothetical protein
VDSCRICGAYEAVEVVERFNSASLATMYEMDYCEPYSITGRPVSVETYVPSTIDAIASSLVIKTSWAKNSQAQAQS